ncbi:hypothetical protein QQ045_030584 [Rhodiola kirilowii]
MCSGENGNGVVDDSHPTLKTLAFDGYATSGVVFRDRVLVLVDCGSFISFRVKVLRRFVICQEARALLGRIEYQKGNVEAALHVFEGIDVINHRNLGAEAKLHKGIVLPNKGLELETWYDLVRIFHIHNLQQWGDAEFCLSRAKAISHSVLMDVI